MKIDASKVRKNFSDYVDLAHGGRVIVIMHHGKPQAKLTSVAEDKTDLDDIREFFGMRSKKKKSGVVTVNQIRARRR